MTEYTQYTRGSIWRRWDLHVHTPETNRHDKFEGDTAKDKWKNFIETINASTEDIAVIGVTDYFSIRNYFKFKELISSNAITYKFDLVLPNIELRISPVTGSAIPINIHCIFDPAIDSQIEARFLSKLKFSNSHSNYSASRLDLIRFGRDHADDQTLDEKTAYLKGVRQYVIDFSSLKNVFDNDPSLRESTIVVVSNKSNDGVSGIVKHANLFLSTTESQLDATRRSIYQFSDAIFSSNENDRNYFIGKGGVDDKKSVIKKCGSLKPCFHGSDAHTNESVFQPVEKRFCWIKADPTFEGLKQCIYEPSERVMIQAIKPDIKNERHVISELEFIDKGRLFKNQKISLNENLNAIIGGKSSGKTLLVFSSASCIDPEQVKRTSQKLGFEGYNFNSKFDFKVFWKNGDVDNLKNTDPNTKLHKITYIPQLYINHLAEKNNKEDLNNLISSILLQDQNFKEFYEKTIGSIHKINSETEKLLGEYLKLRNKLLDNRKKLKEIGSSQNIKKSIDKIVNEVSQGQKNSKLTEAQVEAYNNLNTEIGNYNSELQFIQQEEEVLVTVIEEVKDVKENLLGRKKTVDQASIKGEIDRMFDEFDELPQEIIKIREKLETDFNLLVKNLENEINKLELNKKKSALLVKIKKVETSLKPYNIKFAEQKELPKITLRLTGEKNKYNDAISLETQYNKSIKDYANLRQQIATILTKRIDLYRQIVNKINDTMNKIGDDIELSCSLIYKVDNFALYEQANKAAISIDHLFNTFINGDFINYDLIPEFISRPLKVVDNGLSYEKDKIIPLKVRVTIEDVLRGLIKDSFEIDYSVTYKGDDLLNMSPGKKGTVLLILFLEISSADYPIIIDQPEDNLDNRTIYELLCKMIKEKKKDRQIIIVSHNANLVVATDAENIIVANQQGQDSELDETRPKFEYVNGSLEHSFTKDPCVNSILARQGIREHVCDILEGGGEAFKQRERKYSIAL